MQTGVKKRTELHEKYQDKFKELGVSILYALCLFVFDAELYVVSRLI